MGDTINLVPSPNSPSQHPSTGSEWVVSDDPALQGTPPLIVLHPEVLISGTTVASSSACMRRSVIQSLWAENDLPALAASGPGDGRASGGQLMLAGSIIHEVFQKVRNVHIFTL